MAETDSFLSLVEDDDAGGDDDYHIRRKPGGWVRSSDGRSDGPPTSSRISRLEAKVKEYTLTGLARRRAQDLQVLRRGCGARHGRPAPRAEKCSVSFFGVRRRRTASTSRSRTDIIAPTPPLPWPPSTWQSAMAAYMAELAINLPPEVQPRATSTGIRSSPCSRLAAGAREPGILHALCKARTTRGCPTCSRACRAAPRAALPPAGAPSAAAARPDVLPQRRVMRLRLQRGDLRPTTGRRWWLNRHQALVENRQLTAAWRRRT